MLNSYQFQGLNQKYLAQNYIFQRDTPLSCHQIGAPGRGVGPERGYLLVERTFKMS
jgi:hypothetical protein